MGFIIDFDFCFFWGILCLMFVMFVLFGNEICGWWCVWYFQLVGLVKDLRFWWYVFLVFLGDLVMQIMLSLLNLEVVLMRCRKRFVCFELWKSRLCFIVMLIRLRGVRLWRQLLCMLFEVQQQCGLLDGVRKRFVLLLQ